VPPPKIAPPDLVVTSVMGDWRVSRELFDRVLVWVRVCGEAEGIKVPTEACLVWRTGDCERSEVVEFLVRTARCVRAVVVLSRAMVAKESRLCRDRCSGHDWLARRDGGRERDDGSAAVDGGGSGS
jgi:hypothetical protein